MPRVVVIGGGISGLTAAHRLVEQSRARRRPVEVCLLEAGYRLGGAISTQRRDGFLMEAGPDAFITEKPWALDLCHRLGLDDRLVGTNPAFRRSFVVRNGRLLPVPEGFYLLAPLRVRPFLTSPVFSWWGKLRMACDLVLPRGPAASDESLADFVRRRFGREALERMAQPMVSGVYGADPQALSAQATMPRFRDMERRYRSVIRGLRAAERRERRRSSVREAGGPRYGLFVTLADGLQTLVEVLAARLPSGAVRLGCEVAGLQPIARDGATRWRIALTGGETIEAEGVCVASPAHRAAALVRGFDGALADELAAIRHTSLAVVHLAYRRADVRHPLNGFGFVVPATERRPLLGCTFSSVKFPRRAPEGSVLLRAFLGDELQAGAYALDEPSLVTLMRHEVETLLGIGAPPLWSDVTRHPAAIPQFRVGHLDRMASLERRLATWPGLALAGNAYRGLGIPDCVHSGEQAAEQLWKDVTGGGG